MNYKGKRFCCDCLIELFSQEDPSLLFECSWSNEEAKHGALKLFGDIEYVVARILIILAHRSCNYFPVEHIRSIFVLRC